MKKKNYNYKIVLAVELDYPVMELYYDDINFGELYNDGHKYFFTIYRLVENLEMDYVSFINFIEESKSSLDKYLNG